MSDIANTAVSDNSSTAPSSPENRVRVFALGRFAVEVDGQPLRFGTKTQKRPLALLKLLVAMGAGTVRIEKLADSLWPDSDGDQAYSAFTSALSRLRKLIGRDALSVADGRVGLTEECCWVDAFAFSALLQVAEGAVRDGDQARAASNVEDALKLYRGPFLDGESEPAEILAARERLRGLLVRRLGEVADLLARDGAHEQAVKLYRLGLQAHPDAEELLQGLAQSPGPGKRPDEAGAHADKPSIAVLAFDTFGGDADQAYFANGIAEDIVTQLSKFGWFDVIAANTSLAYKSTGADLRTICQELHLRYALTGGVRKQGTELRVTARLVDAQSGGEIWAERYDAAARKLFQVQDDIVARVVGAINPELYSAEVRRARDRPEENLEVWNHAVRGRWHLTRLTPEHSAEAQRLLEKALALQPDHALAMAFLAYCHITGVFFGWSASPQNSINAARNLARQAYSLSEGDAWVQCALGLTEFVSKRLDEAVALLGRAIELNPSFALAHGYHGLALAHAGRPDEAIAAARHARRLSPRDPELIHFHIAAAVAHFVKREYEQAAHWAMEAVRVRPEAPAAHRVLAAARAHQGQTQAARQAVEELLRLRPSTTAAAVRSAIHFSLPEDQKHYLDGLIKAGLPPG